MTAVNEVDSHHSKYRHSVDDDRGDVRCVLGVERRWIRSIV